MKPLAAPATYETIFVDGRPRIRAERGSMVYTIEPCGIEGVEPWILRATSVENDRAGGYGGFWRFASLADVADGLRVFGDLANLEALVAGVEAMQI